MYMFRICIYVQGSAQNSDVHYFVYFIVHKSTET